MMKKNFQLILALFVLFAVPALAQTKQGQRDSSKTVTLPGDMQKKTYILQGVTVRGPAFSRPIKVSPVTTQILEGKAFLMSYPTTVS